jgi:ABC-type lipoprotein release transport system permease subunit
MRVSNVRGTPMAGQMTPVLPYVLGASVLLVLLIACANAAVLLIAQWTSREADIAIRCSLGASRTRIVRALLTEAVVLGVTAGALGTVVTLVARGWIIHRAGTAQLNLSLDPLIC